MKKVITIVSLAVTVVCISCNSSPDKSHIHGTNDTLNRAGSPQFQDTTDKSSTHKDSAANTSKGNADPKGSMNKSNDAGQH